MAERARPAVTLGCLAAGLGAGAAAGLAGQPLGAGRPAAGAAAAAAGLERLARRASAARRRSPLAADLLGAGRCLWALAFALMALMLAWPLLALLETGALVPALLLSACAGFVLIGLWRLWPAFAQAARSARSFPALVAIAARGGPRPTALRDCCSPRWCSRCSRWAWCWPGPGWCRRRCALPAAARPFRCSRLLCTCRCIASPALAAIAGRSPQPRAAPTRRRRRRRARRRRRPEDADERLYAALRNGRDRCRAGRAGRRRRCARAARAGRTRPAHAADAGGACRATCARCAS